MGVTQTDENAKYEPSLKIKGSSVITECFNEFLSLDTATYKITIIPDILEEKVGTGLRIFIRVRADDRKINIQLTAKYHSLVEKETNRTGTRSNLPNSLNGLLSTTIGTGCYSTIFLKRE